MNAFTAALTAGHALDMLAERSKRNWTSMKDRAADETAAHPGAEPSSFPTSPPASEARPSGVKTAGPPSATIFSVSIGDGPLPAPPLHPVTIPAQTTIALFRFIRAARRKRRSAVVAAQ